MCIHPPWLKYKIVSNDSVHFSNYHQYILFNAKTSKSMKSRLIEGPQETKNRSSFKDYRDRGLPEAVQ